MEKLLAKIEKGTLSLIERIKIFLTLRNFVAKNPMQKMASNIHSSMLVSRNRIAKKHS